MKIQLGTIYTNKTKKFLLSTLIDYGEQFEDQFANLFKLAVGIGDFSLIDMGFTIENSIFILIDTKYSRKRFKDIMLWVKSQKYYEFDYPYDDIHSGHLHMLVVRVPERFENTLTKFYSSKYSEMYEDTDLQKFFSERKEELGVLTRDSQMLVTFVDRVNKMFKTDADSSTWKGEIEFPIRDKEEYFNWELFVNTK